MPTSRYRVWAVEVWKDHDHWLKIFDGMGGHIAAEEYAREQRKRVDSSGKPVRVEVWEMTEEGKQGAT